MLHSRIRLYGPDNRPNYECRLNANRKYDIYALIGGDFNKRRLVKTDISSSDIEKKIKPNCHGCIYC